MPLAPTSRLLHAARALALVSALATASGNCLADIDQPDAIDSVALNKQKTEVTLALLQQKEWTPRTLALLRRKVRAYAVYAKTGAMQRQHPETAGREVVIELSYFVEPDERARTEFDELRAFLRVRGMDMRWFKRKAEK